LLFARLYFRQDKKPYQRLDWDFAMKGAKKYIMEQRKIAAEETGLCILTAIMVGGKKPALVYDPAIVANSGKAT